MCDRFYNDPPAYGQQCRQVYADKYGRVEKKKKTKKSQVSYKSLRVKYFCENNAKSKRACVNREDRPFQITYYTVFIKRRKSMLSLSYYYYYYRVLCVYLFIFTIMYNIYYCSGCARRLSIGPHIIGYFHSSFGTRLVIVRNIRVRTLEKN